MKLVALLGALSVGAFAAVSAFATNGPSTPSLSASPSGSPSSSTSRSFAFSSSAGSSFRCSLDGSAFVTCTSPKAYSGLANGSHSFQVKAVVGSKTSGAASHAWVVDTVPPVVTISFPDDGGVYTATGWNAGCAGGPGICGTATDPSGVASGAVSILQLATGKYWNGSSFSSSTEVFKNVTESSGSGSSFAGRYSLAPPPVGAYTVHARATDAAGNTTSAGSQATVGFTIQSPPPPAVPVITSGPPQLPGWTTTTSASFSFTGDPGVTFLCSLNNSALGAFTACSSIKSYSGVPQGLNTFYVKARNAAGNLSAAASRQWRVDTIDPPKPVFTLVPPNPNSTATSNFDWTPHLPAADVDHYECSKENGSWQLCGPPPFSYAVQTTNNGQHQFGVRAIDAAGNSGGSISYKWKVVAGSGQDFTITGSVSNLQIGVAKTIPVTLTNPNSVPIYVTALAATLSLNAGSGGCTASNFSFTQSSATSAAPITVPANSSLTLTAAPQAPRLTLLNLPTNQDVCKSKSFTLTFSGSAHS